MREFDWLLLLAALVLCAAGLALIYSVFTPPPESQEVSAADYTFLQRQALWVAFGLVAMVVGIAIPFRYFESLAWYTFLACVALLLVVLFVGSGHEAHRWLAIGGIRLQPSELTKVALIFLWARVLSGPRGREQMKKKLVLSLGALAIPFLLVLKEPDLGTALMFVLLLLPMLYAGGVSGLHLLFALSPLVTVLLGFYGDYAGGSPWPLGIYLVAIFILAYARRSYLIEAVGLVVVNLGVAALLPVLWTSLTEYQQRRIHEFLNFGSDRFGSGWQVFQSKVAIGSGGILGKGFTKGTQKAMEFIPAKHTDFIFSVAGEELGFVGALLLILLFFTIVVRALDKAARARNRFASLASVGVAAYFFFQSAINIGMAVGLAPVTGLPLPLVSYGGSSMLVSMFLVGFLVNVGLRCYDY